MATFRIHELPNAPYTNGSVIPALPSIDSITAQTPITTSGTSQQSAAFTEGNKLAVIEAIGGAVHVQAGTTPTATTSSVWMAADRPLTIKINAGDKIAVIDAS